VENCQIRRFRASPENAGVEHVNPGACGSASAYKRKIAGVVVVSARTDDLQAAEKPRLGEVRRSSGRRGSDSTSIMAIGDDQVSGYSGVRVRPRCCLHRGLPRQGTPLKIGEALAVVGSSRESCRLYAIGRGSRAALARLNVGVSKEDTRRLESLDIRWGVSMSCIRCV